MIPEKPTISEVRALVREERSTLLADAADDVVDRHIRENIGRPAATPSWVASMAASGAEFDSLCRRLQAALSDGSVLDAEPAGDKALRVFRCVAPPAVDDPAAARTHEAAGRQLFLARRLYTLAGDIVDDAGADIDSVARAFAVGAVLHVIAALHAPIAREVVLALPANEWQALREAWRVVVDSGKMVDAEPAA